MNWIFIHTLLFSKVAFWYKGENRLYLWTKRTQRRAENQQNHPIQGVESGIELGNYRWGASAITIVPACSKVWSQTMVRKFWCKAIEAWQFETWEREIPVLRKFGHFLKPTQLWMDGRDEDRFTYKIITRLTFPLILSALGAPLTTSEGNKTWLFSEYCSAWPDRCSEPHNRELNHTRRRRRHERHIFAYVKKVWCNEYMKF